MASEPMGSKNGYKADNTSEGTMASNFSAPGSSGGPTGIEGALQHPRRSRSDRIGQVRPARIADVLREIDADVIALQEVVCGAGWCREDDQGRFLAEHLVLNCELGQHRKLKGLPAVMPRRPRRDGGVE
jgi:hypothetical protein